VYDGDDDDVRYIKFKRKKYIFIYEKEKVGKQ